MVGDLLTPYGVPLDLIVSNPPYVSQVELASPDTAPEIGRFEPSLALDGGLNGLDIIRRLLSQAKKRLESHGSLLVEIGADQGQSIMELGRVNFPQASIEIKQDLAGLDRLLVVKN
jgi:release factor glutamine methyltransferase